jgi:hypothetical protein
MTCYALRKFGRLTKESDDYEHVTQVLQHNLRQHLEIDRVEGSRKHRGQRSGILRQIDITAYKTEGKNVLVECKRHNTPIDVEYMEAFYYIVYRDVGADSGLMVSPLGFTAGAEGVAKAEKIGMATLNAAATEDDYNLKIIREHLGGINDHFWGVSNTCSASDEGSCLQSTPVEHNEERS